MIAKVADKIELRLKELDVFKEVEQSISNKLLNSPPSAAFFLAYDRKATDMPSVSRLLGWDVVILVQAISQSKGISDSGNCIDAVRDGFTNWQPFPNGGCLPVEAPEIRLEGMQNTLLVYTARIVMKILPGFIDKE